MKKIVLLISCAAAMCVAGTASAQSFVPEADTVWKTASTSGLTKASDSIAVPGAPVTLEWRIAQSNFPSDWLAEMALGICDANLCRQNTGGQLWNGTAGTLYSCTYPGLGNSHNFYLQMDLNGKTPGTYYMTARVSDNATLYSKQLTFIVTNGTTAVSAVQAGITGINIIPNPAQGKAQAVFTLSAASSVQCNVFDMAGRSVHTTAGRALNAGQHTIDLPVADMAAGVYTVAITTEKGTVTQQLTVAK